MLTQSVSDSKTVVQQIELQITDENTYIMRLRAIIDRDTKTTRCMTIVMVKVQWKEDHTYAT